jgi:Spy/CpxP family protein refolding chaperone
MKFRMIVPALFLAFLFLAPAVHAQDQGGAPAGSQGQGRGAMSERRMQAMFKDITLTAAQKITIDSIMTHRRGEMRRGSPASGDSSETSARRAMMQKQNADIRAVLTPEQRTVFDRNVEALRSRMRAGT